MTSPDPTMNLAHPITMEDVRLAVGEGELRPEDVLAGCNAELRRRIAFQTAGADIREKVARVIDGRLTNEGWIKNFGDMPDKDGLTALQYVRHNALIRADAILALVSPTLVAGWRPIESAPRDGTSILAYPHYVITHWTDELVAGLEGWAGLWDDGWDAFFGLSIAPTHWMLLPSAPQPAGNADV